MSNPTTNVGTTDGSTFLSGLYSGSVSLGMFRATLSLVAAIVIGVLIVMVSMYCIFYNDDDRYINVTGKVMKAECEPITTYDEKGRPITRHKCNIVVGYKINDREYSNSIFTTSTEKYLVNEPIALWVDAVDHDDVQLAGIKSSHIGSALSCFAVMIVLAAYLNYYMTNRFEIYASAQGASTVVDVFK